MHALSQQFLGLISEFGLPALFLIIFLESFGLPLPGESAIVGAAALAASRNLDLAGVALAAFMAAVLGDNLGYLIGRRLGRPFIARYGSGFGLSDARLAKVEDAARRYGAIMVIFARFFVLLRQLNGLGAGAANMRWSLFLAANVVGAALWVALWTSLAYLVGKSGLVPFLWHHLSWVAAVAIPLLLVALVVARATVTRRR